MTSPKSLVDTYKEVIDSGVVTDLYTETARRYFEVNTPTRDQRSFVKTSLFIHNYSGLIPSVDLKRPASDILDIMWCGLPTVGNYGEQELRVRILKKKTPKPTILIHDDFEKEDEE